MKAMVHTLQYILSAILTTLSISLLFLIKVIWIQPFLLAFRLFLTIIIERVMSFFFILIKMSLCYDERLVGSLGHKNNRVVMSIGPLICLDGWLILYLKFNCFWADISIEYFHQ
jgi:hypothetical protein